MIISKKKYEMAIKEAVEKEMNAYDKQRYERSRGGRKKGLVSNTLSCHNHFSPGRTRVL